MNKVISLKKLRFRRRKITSRPKRNVDVKPQDRNINIFKIIVSAASVFSVLLGSLFYSKMSSEEIRQYFINLINQLQGESFTNTFRTLCSIEIIFIAICFILGTNLFGNIFISLVPIAKTFLAGYIGALMYNKYELNGVLFSLIFFVPYLSVTSSILIAMTNEGYIMSKSMTNCIMQRKTAQEGILQLFLIRFIIIAVFDLLFVLLNSLLLSSFGTKISLQ